MGGDPRQQYHSYSIEPQNHACLPKIVCPKKDMVHVALKASQRNQCDVDHDETNKSHENKKVNRACALSAAEHFRI